MIDGFYRTVSSPDPLACETASDCVGDTVADASGCCNDPYSIRAHSKAYRQWVSELRKRACVDVTCPPPPLPSRPLECNFELRCVDKKCMNSCPASK